MTDDNAQGWAHQLELEHRRFLEERALWEQAMLKVDPGYAVWLNEECCEHGIHRDSGHVCNECLVNRGNEDAE